MSELSFEQMLEESLKTIRTGEVVTGKVIDVKEDEIVLNIGYKSDGITSTCEAILIASTCLSCVALQIVFKTVISYLVLEIFSTIS